MPISDSFAQRIDPLIPDLVNQYPTPFHLYDVPGILATHQEMVSCFGDWPFRQYFAVKALPNPAVLKALVEAGSGLDCSSPAELSLAKSCNAVDDTIVFTSNNSTISEYQQAIRLNALITFDDLHYLHRLEQLPETVAFRISPQSFPSRSSLIGGDEGSKFGVPRKSILKAYHLAFQRGVTHFGIHGMACANELDTNKAIEAAQMLVEIAASISQSLGINFDYINFGGGMGIPYLPHDIPFNFRKYALAICNVIASAFTYRPRVLMECGRYVTGPHGILVARVINRIQKEREIAGLDASMSALMRPGIYPNAYHHITLPFAEHRSEVIIDVVGALCENIDRFAIARKMPNPQEGDIVYIHDTGAHGHAMGFNYNGRLRPAELMLTEDGKIVEIRRRETYEDYTSTIQWEPVSILPGQNEGRYS